MLNSQKWPIVEHLLGYSVQLSQTELAAAVEILFPDGMFASACVVNDSVAPLFPVEELLVARAGENRRREFAAGRAAARTALSKAGASPIPVLAEETGEPLWPAGFVGSITHAGGWAIAAVATTDRYAALGIDLESDEPLDTRLLPLVCRRDEIEGNVKLGSRVVDAAKLRFVAKEAFYKATFPKGRRFIEFEEIFIAIDPGSNRFDARLMSDRDVAAETRAASGIFIHQGSMLCAVCAW
jgi:4'-phosphopantetheinyl transferase EntD